MAEGDLQVSKNILSKNQMSEFAYIEEAAGWSRELTRMRARGPGDTENAMRAIERDYGINYWTLWQLRYKRQALKDIGIGIYTRIKAAWETERQRQYRKLQIEFDITKKIAGVNHPVVAEIESILGPPDDS
jgi:hypothetical protein